MKLDLRRRLRDLIQRKILGVEDTPHRIALGVFLGMLIGWTPTFGFQIVIYLAIAAMVRANKISGIPFVFISNPFTLGPLYYWAWVVGAWLLHLGDPPAKPTADAVSGVPKEVSDSIWDIGVTKWEFWIRLWEELAAIGVELWFGSLVMGVITGVPAYIMTHRAVRRHREKVARERALAAAEQAPDAEAEAAEQGPEDKVSEGA